MNWVKPAIVVPNIILSSFLWLVLVGVPLQLEPAQAQPSNQSSLIARIKRFFLGDRPRGTATNRKGGGAVRDRCPNIQPPLLALIPSTPDDVPFIEKTIQDSPTFWFYIPFPPTSGRNAEFAIINENEEDVYAAKFPLTQQPGIVRLQLPHTALPLQESKRYRWIFSVICNPANRSGDATVNGWVQRVPLSQNLKLQLQQKSEIAVISAYAEAGLWYEMLTAIAEFQQQNPQNPQAKVSWVSTLGRVGLSNSASYSWKTYRLP